MKPRTQILFCSPACLCLAAVLMFSSRTSAQITVATVADENETQGGSLVSLRQALRESADGAQITFDPSLAGKVLVLTSGEIPVIGKTVTVSAPGGLVIEARGLSRIFNVAAGAGLNVSGLTLQGGLAPADGGAILNAGTLSLTDCVLRENRAANGASGPAGATGGTSSDPEGPPGGGGGTGSGGGAVSSTGILSALRCHFTGNAAGTGGTGGRGGFTHSFPMQTLNPGDGGAGGTGGAGGAILSAGPMTFTECIFESNRTGAGGTGGDGWSSGYSTGGNGGKSGDGGAISQAGGMTVERSSFAGNACPSAGEGGTGYPNSHRGGPGSGTAVFWSSGTATLINCTLSGNGISEGAYQQVESGGVIAAGTGTLLRLVHCTLSGNLVGPASTAAGIVSIAPVQCHNCIISGNLRNRSSTSTPDWNEVNFSPNTPSTVIPFGPLGGTPGVNAELSPLIVTFGPLPVLVPEATSPALNWGAILSSPPATDQRGLPRAVGAPDLGAVEVQLTEAPPRTLQSITFPPPASFQESSVSLSATASSGLPVSFEYVSGPANLNGNILTFTSPGFAAVRASQAGNSAIAPALPVIRVIEATHFIPFTPAQSYTVYPQNPAVITLPTTTLAGLPVVWSLTGTPGAGVSLTGNVLTVPGAGLVEVRGQNAGNAQYAAVDTTWTLNFVQGALWWETPPAPFGGPLWFTLVEGSPHGLTMTAHIAAPHSSPVPVPVPAGVTATPSAIPVGQTSVQCQFTVPANPALVNQTRVVPTAYSWPFGTPVNITLFLANRANIPLDVFAPARVSPGTSTLVDVSAPGVPTAILFGPPPDLGLRSVTISASDYDNPAISVPVTLDSETTDAGPYPRKHLRITFPPMDRRVKLIVTTDDGITGQSGPIQISTDPSTDGDGINDIVETALQHTPDHFDEPPLTIQHDAAGLHAVLGSRPLDLQGWTVVIELSADLQTWTPAPAASITVIPNPGSTTERVSVLLSAGQRFARLKVSKP